MPADNAPIPLNARQRRTRRHLEAVPDQPTEPATDDHKGRMWVGPTSEQTRRLVAESRLRQGLPPHIDNPAVIETLALFLRNALNTLEHTDQQQQNHPHAA